MPPLPDAPNILKLRLIGNLQGTQPWNNVLHIRYTGPAPLPGQLQTMAGQIATAWGTNLASLCAAENNLTEVALTDLTDALAASGAANVAIPGTRVGTSFMAQVCMVASWLGQYRWRGGHFRTYFPFGVTNDRANVFQWNQTFITAALAGCQAFLAALNALLLVGAPVQVVGLSYKTKGVFRVNPLPIGITGVVIHPRVDTQRKRLGKEHV